MKSIEKLNGHWFIESLFENPYKTSPAKKTFQKYVCNIHSLTSNRPPTEPQVLPRSSPSSRSSGSPLGASACEASSPGEAAAAAAAPQTGPGWPVKGSPFFSRRDPSTLVLTLARKDKLSFEKHMAILQENVSQCQQFYQASTKNTFPLYTLPDDSSQISLARCDDCSQPSGIVW